MISRWSLIWMDSLKNPPSTQSWMLPIANKHLVGMVSFIWSKRCKMLRVVNSWHDPNLNLVSYSDVIEGRTWQLTPSNQLASVIINVWYLTARVEVCFVCKCNIWALPRSRANKSVFFKGTFICFDIKWTPDQGIYKKNGPPPHVLYFLITSTSVFPEGGQTMFVGRKTHNAGLLQHWWEFKLK